MMDRTDEFRGKGAVEQESREQEGNTSLAGQLGHRDKVPMLEGQDTDFPEPGENPEHTGEVNSMQADREKPENQEPEPEKVEQDPGERQKENQNREKTTPWRRKQRAVNDRTSNPAQRNVF